jgi:hypothetical protein
MKTITQTQLKTFVNMTRSACYNYEMKERYKRLGKKILLALVEYLQLQPGEYDIRFNPGGIACSGDHILHTDKFYVDMSDNCNLGWFYYRSCQGRKDYTGGVNRIVYWPMIINHGIEGLGDAIKRDCLKNNLTPA